MITLSNIDLLNLVAAFIWPFTRIMGLMALAPLYNNASLPAPMKILLASMLAFLVAPAIPNTPAQDLMSLASLLILAQELMIGLAMGLTMRIAFAGVEFAGDVTGLTMGLGFATFFDPQTEGRSSAISQFLALLTLMIYISANVHLLVLSTLVESFHTLPIGSASHASFHVEQLLKWGGSIFSIGLQLSLPIVAVLLITNTALGILTRAAPQLNLFGIGFPVTIGMGYVMLGLSLPFFSAPLLAVLQEAIHAMQHITAGPTLTATPGLN